MVCESADVEMRVNKRILKCIDADEQQALIRGSVTVGVVYELRGGSPDCGGLPGSIDAASGTLDGGDAVETLKKLGAPQGVVVNFWSILMSITSTTPTTT